MNELIPTFGARKSPYDSRDFQLGEIVRTGLPTIPPETYFLDIANLPVWHQHKIGACVGHAWGKSQQYCEYAETGKVIPLSARFLYAVSKCLDGAPEEGTYPRLTAKVLKDYGCATEATVPNDTLLDHETYVYNRDITKIPKDAFDEAKQYGINGYAFAKLTEQGIKEAIYYAGLKRQGVVMLLLLGDSFWTDINGNVTWAKDAILPIRPPANVVSGHEVYPIGFEQVGERLKIWFLNSWSKDWGDNGKGWFWYDEYKDFIQEVMTSIDKADVPPKFIFTKTLSFGMKNDAVLELQKRLVWKGYGSFAPTGYYGPLTANSVFAFQKANIELSWYERNILRGTKVGPKTLAKLNE